MASSNDDNAAAHQQPGSSPPSVKEDASSYPTDGQHQLTHSGSGADEEESRRAKDLGFAPAYTGKRSWYRSTFTNATILGLCSFLSPGIWGAMSATGGGGQSSASTVNAANAITFVLMIFTSYLTSSLINLVNIPFALAIGTSGYSVYAAGLYLSSKTDGAVTWLVIFGAACCGISAGFFWSTEGAVILTYPEADRKGKYISYWLMFRVMGQLVGGAINLGLNVNDSEAGALAPNTFIVFVVLQCIAPFVALLISKPTQVQRRDRTPVQMNLTGSVRSECIAVWRLLTRREVLLLLPMIWQSTFSEALVFTYNATYFTVRSRALGSFLSAIVAVIGNYILGFFLDWKKLSINRRGNFAFYTVYILQGAWWIYSIVILNDLHRNPPAQAFDWSNQGPFAKHFALFIVQILGFNMMYEYTYWIMSALSPENSPELVRLASIVRGVESAGQALSYGLNATTWRLDAVAGLNFGFYGLCLLPAWSVIRHVGLNVDRDGHVLKDVKETQDREVASDIKRPDGE